jgi:hypothetical protein
LKLVEKKSDNNYLPIRFSFAQARFVGLDIPRQHSWVANLMSLLSADRELGLAQIDWYFFKCP